MRQLFLKHLAQTSTEPIAIEVVRAEGIYMYGPNNETYIDLIAGVSVSNVGHCHPKVVAAVCKQAQTYMHLMVYGEYIQAPQVLYAKALSDLLPPQLQSVYLVNSGSEANEAALKLAKRHTGRSEMIGFHHAYHGGTHGVLSLMGHEDYRQAFRPLLPDIKQLPFNCFDQLAQITHRTACVIVEPLQGEAGAIVPKKQFLQALRKRCDETGALLIFDEIQTGFGRLGEYFAFQHYGVVPDILTLAKGMGGGMPLGGMVASFEMMADFQSSPILGHISTFGGHPVSCAAALAALEVIRDEKLVAQVARKATLFRTLLQDTSISEIRGDGLLMAVELDTPERLHRFIDKAFAAGLATDWFLFCETAFRIAPPLTISEDEIAEVCRIIKKVLSSL